RRCSVIFGSLTYGRMRYRLAQPGEMDDRRFQVATVAGKLTLFIDGRCDPVVYLLPGLLVARRSKRLQLVIRGFRLGKAIQVELRMGNDGPCRARKAVLYRRHLGHRVLRHGNGKIELLLAKQVLGNRGQHSARLRMLGIRRGKLESAVEISLVP